MLNQINKLLWLCIPLMFSCTKYKEKKSVETSNPVAVEKQITPAPEIHYHYVANSYKQFDSLYNATQAAILLPLNRIDRRNLRRIDSLITPDTFISDWNVYAPFPNHISLIDSIHRILFFSYRIQAFAAYENGQLIKWGPSSLGKKSTPTQTGLFHCNWKAKSTISTVDADWKLNWYVNLDNRSGVSIHEYELPGYPASHACARLSAEDAKWVYHWIDEWKLSDNGQQVILYGTPVCVFGSYDFEKPLLQQIFHNDQMINIPLDSVEQAIKPHIPVILQRQTDRANYQEPVN